MTYRIHGLAALSDLLGDFIVYRSLRPADPRLPGLADLAEPLRLDPKAAPRKAEPAYGLAVAEILRRARACERPGAAIRQLLYVGDTHMNDGTAFRNLCAAGGWPGWAFIGQDEARRPAEVAVDGPIFLANRWSALGEFLTFVAGQGAALDEGTALVIDLDKTAVGARGRNDLAIDEARVLAVKRTVAHLLGPHFDEAAFQRAYDELKRPAYHPFTADNQDYLAYICLMLGAGLFDLDGLLARLTAGDIHRFEHFLSQVQDRPAALARAGLAEVHAGVWRNVQAGDPTPFKAFRYEEYRTTAERFGDLPGAPVEEVLARRVVITQEVLDAGLALRERDALVFGVSDKPDEASLPNPEQARAGMLPLHRLRTLVVGAD
jgi:hypothetical protein